MKEKEKLYQCVKCKREWEGILTGSSKCVRCQDGWMIEKTQPRESKT